MFVASLLPLALFIMPLWTIELGAPQYPEPLGMEIWINKIDGIKAGDIQNINLMNHYVGMKKIPEHMKEFDLFPYVVIGLSLLGIIFAFLGKRILYFIWFWGYILLGTIGMYDFYLWEYEYGHSLDPKAAIKFMDETGKLLTYQPPLFGTEHILNFEATSLPGTGAYFLAAAIAFSGIAYYLGRIESGLKLPKI